MKSQSNRHKQKKTALALAIGVAVPLLLIISLVHNARAFALQSPHATICVKPGGGDGCQATISNALAIAVAGDTIQVAAGEYVENLTINRTVTLEGGWNDAFTTRDPQTYSVTIRPADETQTVVSIQNTHPTIDGFTITGGRADMGNNHGGGLRLVDSDAVLRNNTIVDNRAYLFGGGVWVQRGAPLLENNRIENNRSLGANQDAFGGGVQLENTAATLANNLIAANVVSGTNAFGGGVDAIGNGPRLEGNTIADNHAIGAEQATGGGISLRHGGPFQIILNRVRDNQSTVLERYSNAYGGGAAVLDSDEVSFVQNVFDGNQAHGPSEGGQGWGGGVSVLDARAVAVTGSHVEANTADIGGGILLQTSTVTLSDTQVCDNQGESGGGITTVQGSLRLTGSEVCNNEAGTFAGGILVYANSGPGMATIEDSAISGNSSNDAGGLALYPEPFARVTVRNSTIRDNEGAIGGLWNYEGVITLTHSTLVSNTGDVGGGIGNLGTMMLTSSTLSGNMASSGGAIANVGALTMTSSAVHDNTASAHGAAISHEPGDSQTLHLQNVTISGNESGSSGAVYFDGDAALLNATVSDNSPTGVFWQSGDVTTRNTIFAANGDANCNAPLLTLGYNLEDADDCGLDAGMNDLLFSDPLLAPLADNGGDTLTHALDPASPAIDAADDGACTDYDQRGRPRVDGDFDGDITCDIGAFEYLPSFLVNSAEDQLDGDEGDGVCDTGDVVDNKPECSLRAAIQEANALGGAETISLPAGVYALTIANPPPAAPQAPALDTDDFAASGDLDVRVSVTIAGAGRAETIVDAQELDRVFDIISPTERLGLPPRVQISGLTISNGRAENDDGGGIYNDGVLTLSHSAVLTSRTDDPDNARAGGGIFNNHILLLDHVLLAANQSDDGGALFTEGLTGSRLQHVTIRDNVASQSAGGINNNGALTITHSTLSANSADMFNGGAILNNDTVWLENSTLSANVAADFGGAIRNANQAIFHSVTVANNQAQDGGGIYNDGEVLLHNTILAGNGGGACVDNDTLQSLGYNLEDGHTCNLDPTLGDLLSADPRLGPLQDNGGATLTHALRPGSPAIDAGSLQRCPHTDQRGVTRPLDGDGDDTTRCDIGAFEFQYEEDEEEDPTFALHLPVFFR